jgi:hypothetical protein
MEPPIPTADGSTPTRAVDGALLGCRSWCGKCRRPCGVATSCRLPERRPILPEHQDLKVGDCVPIAKTVNHTRRSGSPARSRTAGGSGRNRTAPGRGSSIPLDASRTRLTTRLKDLYAWRTSPGNALLSLILFEFGDLPMTRKLLLGVKQRAEHLVEEGGVRATT